MVWFKFLILIDDGLSMLYKCGSSYLYCTFRLRG